MKNVLLIILPLRSSAFDGGRSLNMKRWSARAFCSAAAAGALVMTSFAPSEAVVLDGAAKASWGALDQLVPTAQADVVPSGPVEHDGIVSDVPASWTPALLDGRTLDIVQVGNTMVVGGTFQGVQQFRVGPVIEQPHVVAFNATYGRVNRNFTPELGSAARALEEGPTSRSVYVAGGFAGIDGVGGKVHLLNVSDGSRVSSFDGPALNGPVNDMKRVGNDLYLAGSFTIADGLSRRGLVKLDATTGAVKSDFNVALTTAHNFSRGGNFSAPVGALRIAVNPTGDTLAVVGNFRRVGGRARDQVALIDIGSGLGQVRANWRTQGYEPVCNVNQDGYVRDVAFSPDGTTLTVAAKGGRGNLCDSAATFGASDVGQDLQPQWTNITGGDSLLSVASTGSAMYLGGHQRWMNNPEGTSEPGVGAVPRPGLGALDPDSGIPVSWNPGRHPRGIGAGVLEATEAGLWVGSDTDWVGRFEYKRPKLAFFPLAGGVAVAEDDPGSLPANVYRVGSSQLTGDGEQAQAAGTGLSRSYFNPGGAFAFGADDQVQLPADARDMTAAFMVDDTLFYASSDNTFNRRTFDGTSFGDATVVDPYNDAFWSPLTAGTKGTYRGLRPGLYNVFDDVAGLAYADDRMYITKDGTSSVFYRSFSPDSGIMASRWTRMPNFNHAKIGGLFVDDETNTLYFGDQEDGTLSSVPLVDGLIEGEVTTVSGPEIDGLDWSNPGMFLGPGPEGAGAQAQAAEDTDAEAVAAEAADDVPAQQEREVAADAQAQVAAEGAAAEGAAAEDETVEDAAAEAAAEEDADADVAEEEAQAEADADAGTAEAVASPVRVGDVNATGVGTSVSVELPGDVQAGDALVAFFTANQSGEGGAPVGVGAWDQVGREVNGPLAVSVFSRVADGSEGGQELVLSVPDRARMDVTVVVYRGVGGVPVEVAESLAVRNSASHVSPEVSVGGAGRVVLSFWADRSSSTTSWTAPGGLDEVSNVVGTGGGRLATLLGEAAAEEGEYGELTATTDAPSSRGVAYSVVLQP